MTRPIGFIVFFAIALTIFGALHYYIWARLVRDTQLPPPWRLILTVVLIVLWAGLPLTFLTMRRLSPGAAGWLAWPAFLWMGLLFLFFITLLTFDVGRGIARLAAYLLHKTDVPDPIRRTWLARVFGGTAAVAASGVGLYAVRAALGPVAVKNVKVALERLPLSLDGTTIVQLSDVHVGPTIGRSFLEDVVRRTNALKPDVIAITGDLVDGSVEQLRDSIAPLGDLKARYGVFFVTGNHEYISGVDEWMKELSRLGIRVLRNERVTVGSGEAAFDLAGVDDWSATRFQVDGHGPDLKKALAGRDPSRALVLLAHQPRAVREAAELGVSLQLSGHTHGGQIWPFGYLVHLQQPFVAGLGQLGETQIYVSRGTGYWGPPMRLAAPSEITHITLQAPIA